MSIKYGLRYTVLTINILLYIQQLSLYVLYLKQVSNALIVLWSIKLVIVIAQVSYVAQELLFVNMIFFYLLKS